MARVSGSDIAVSDELRRAERAGEVTMEIMVSSCY